MSFGNLFGGSDLALIDGLLLSALGVTIVFIVLAFLMLFIALMSKILGSAAKKKAKAKEPAAPAVAEAATEPELAKGSCGSVKLFDVDDRTAAMLMAIVADKLQKPLNELRFVSIREIQE